MLSALLLTHVVAISATEPQDPYAEYKAKLVAVGKMAPNFIVKDDSGKEFDFHKNLKKTKAKATIINFWFAH